MNINIPKTQEYYHALSNDSLCSCNYCINYRQQIKAEYPKTAEYLASLGVDIEKPFETSPLEPGENGMLEYCCCQYIVFGTCESKYHHKIGDVKLRLATSYPSTGIEEEHFVIELSPIRLKYIV